MTTTLTASQITEARDWIADCFSDVDAGDLTEAEVIAGVKRHYDGGLSGFIADGVA